MEKKKKNVMKAYFRWPFYLGFLLVLLAVLGYFISINIGLLLTGIVVIYYLTAFLFYFVTRKSMLKKLVDFGAEYAQVQNQLLRQIDIPFAMCNSQGEIFWYNPEFQLEFGLKKKNENLFLPKLLPAMENANFDKEQQYQVDYGSRRYSLTVHPLRMENIKELTELDDSERTRLYSIYLIDETELVKYRQELAEERNVMALIYIDNYDEVMEGVEYVRRSLLAALVERKLNKYASGVQAVVRKMEKDRYLFVMKQEGLWKLQKNKFALLEDIKTVNIGNEMAVTISMGIGVGGESIEQNYDYASAAIDMALGRGGDQVVMKSGSDIRYFGGQVKTTEKNTRVKARIKAHALRELIEARENVVIMGHPIGDMDCFGAAMGIYRCAKFSGKRAYIVTGELSNSVKPVVAMFRNNADYGELFVDHLRAMEILNKDSLLVVVDTNRPSYTECPDLLKRAQHIVVMDHHRQGRDRIEDADLSYVEPYASSASEMVAEVVQYYDETLKLKPSEADAVFAGIVMDTNNFEDKAGVRTFEAAAYLKRAGADVTRVRKLFRESMEDYQLRAETVQKVELFNNDYAISICPSVKPNRNQTVIAAQAANELLEVRGVKASFVFTEHDGKIFLSARSIDEVNVQLLMEQLGGGGHASIAGAQFTGIEMNEAVNRLKQVLGGSSEDRKEQT